MPAAAPTAMPPMTPPDMGVDALPGESLDPGDEAAGEDVVAGDVAVEVVPVEDVCVAAIKTSGSKDQELAEGFAELRDEKVWFSTLALMLLSVSCAELQQMLI